MHASASSKARYGAVAVGGGGRQACTGGRGLSRRQTHILAEHWAVEAILRRSGQGDRPRHHVWESRTASNPTRCAWRSRCRVRILSIAANGSDAGGRSHDPKRLSGPRLRRSAPDATAVAPDVHERKARPSTPEATATKATSTEEAGPAARGETRLQRLIRASEVPHASAGGCEMSPPATSRPPAFLLYRPARSPGDVRAAGIGRRRTSVAARGPCDVACVWRP